MNAPIQSSLAQAVAWVWRCPLCQARVVVTHEKGGLVLHRPSPHSILARKVPGGHLEVQYAVVQE